jgi:hypothetical protein
VSIPSRISASVSAILLAVSASLLANESFIPVAERFHVEGREAGVDFQLAAGEPLFLEFELVLSAPGDARPAVVIGLNGTSVSEVRPVALHRTEFGKVELPPSAVREGPNRLDFTIRGAPESTFDISARVNNYYGIAPDFPRVFVVGDSAVTYRFAQQSLVGWMLRFAVFLPGAWLVVWVLDRMSRGTASGWHVGRWSPLLGLLAVLGYSLATPLHIWLSLEALAVLIAVPWVFGEAVLWMAAHRATVGRVAAVTAVTLVLLETSLRVVNTFSPIFIFYSDSFGRYRGQPGAPHFDARLNSRGFNDVEREVTRPVHVRHRVVAIGDSFAFGVVPRADNYLSLLERALTPDGSVEVINMGVAGTEPRDYLAILVEEGLAFRPDLVVVGFYVGNDFEARARKPYEHSYVATLGHFLWTLGRAGRSVVVSADATSGAYDDGAPSLDEEAFRRILMDRAVIYMGEDAALAGPAARAASYLREMRDLSAGAGADLLVVLLPDEVQVDEALQRDVARAWGVSRESIDLTRPTRVITEALSREGIRVLDLLPAFAGEGARARLYKPRDTHWNIEGNRLAATTMTPTVREMLRRR